VNALLAGEIDIIEAPQTTCCRCSKKDRTSRSRTSTRWGNQYSLRFNVLHKPFDNAKIRQAMLYALNQKDFLLAGIGDPNTTRSARRCSSAARPTRPTRASRTSSNRTSPSRRRS
jgi:ABC-type oligopeptide transport system substrate-binding subunit